MATRTANPDFTVTPVGDDDTIWLSGHQHELEVILDFESVRLSTAQLHKAMSLLGDRNRIRSNVVDTLYMIPRVSEPKPGRPQWPYLGRGVVLTPDDYLTMPLPCVIYTDGRRPTIDSVYNDISNKTALIRGTLLKPPLNPPVITLPACTYPKDWGTTRKGRMCTPVCGVFTRRLGAPPRKNSNLEQELAVDPSARACVICERVYKKRGVQGMRHHFPSCVAKHGNPAGNCYDGHESFRPVNMAAATAAAPS